jgi:hypothetical protein
MAIPQVNLHVQDGGLGASVPGAGGTMVVIGVSSAGTSYQRISSTQPADFVTNNGYGPAPELAAFIANQTGNDMILIKCPSATPGANTGVTTARAASSTCVVTVTGTPNDSYYGRVDVVTGGTIGVAGIIATVSLDNGRTTYATINLGTASTYVIPNTGLTLNFAAGTLDIADRFSWVSTEPLWSSAGVVSAIQALYGETTPFQNILIVGGSTGTSSTGGPGATAGDIATIDETGFIRITDRLSRFSKIAGEMVPHMKVEEQLQALLRDPHVCVVTSVPDATKGERLVALYTDPGLPAQELCEQLSRSDLPKLWIPKREDFHVVGSIPTLGTGKTDLRAVRQLAIDRSD